MAKPDPTDKLLEELLKGKKPEEILGEKGLLDELTKRLIERALGGFTFWLWSDGRAPSCAM